MNGQRLTHSQIPSIRSAQLVSQRNTCALCKLPGVASDPVLDHCHTTGAVRGTLHRSCNSLLGKIENNAARFGVKNMGAFLHGCAEYLQRHSTNITGLIHPLHKTADEKRLARNAKAVKARAAARKAK